MPERTRYLSHFIALFAVLVIALNAPAQDIPSDDPHAADRAELLKLKDTYEKAVNSNELDTLENLIAEGYYGVMVTGHETQSFQDLKDYWADIRNKMGADGTYEVQVLPQPALFSGNHAISHGKTIETVKASGKTFPFESLWTAVFVKEADGWKLLRLHASMDPIDNAFVHTWRQQAITWSAVIGAAAGFVAGGALFWLLGRRKTR